MKIVQAVLVGFLVSFLGSIPLGYLNIIGYEIFSKSGVNSLLMYLLGVVVVEAVVIYFTLIFANRLVKNKKLMKTIDVFGILFLLFLAYFFFAHSNQDTNHQSYLDQYLHYSPFLIGLFLSSINFLQLPFWTAWNVYLINEKYIDSSIPYRFFYLAGTITGTFLGMITLVYFLNKMAQDVQSVFQYFIPIFIPVFFVILALLKSYKVIKKYAFVRVNNKN